jgi:hypothetical protein
MLEDVLIFSNSYLGLNSKNVNHVISFGICVTFSPSKMVIFKHILNAIYNDKC